MTLQRIERVEITGAEKSGMRGTNRLQRCRLNRLSHLQSNAPIPDS